MKLLDWIWPTSKDDIRAMIDAVAKSELFQELQKVAGGMLEIEHAETAILAQLGVDIDNPGKYGDWIWYDIIQEVEAKEAVEQSIDEGLTTYTELQSLLNIRHEIRKRSSKDQYLRAFEKFEINKTHSRTDAFEEMLDETGIKYTRETKDYDDRLHAFDSAMTRLRTKSRS